MTLPGTAIDPSTVRNYQIFSITSNSFEMSWHVSSTLNHTFQVQVFRDKDIVQNLKTEEMKMDVFGLEAGVMYSVWISYETCGKTIIVRQNVKTGKQPLKKNIYIFSLSLPPHLFLPPLAVHQWSIWLPLNAISHLVQRPFSLLHQHLYNLDYQAAELWP